ncbi:cysteine dioxygenase family protein [Nocardia sp. CNY236]|uniref:cysteine dioxygenase n=1 Tax=Nocardia sp. CNY236 TaxID=1169152 RepID=UPI0004274260|nr:cysteine dioxygenase family protein [Nocardia sp. CNY236]
MRSSQRPVFPLFGASASTVPLDRPSGLVSPTRWRLADLVCLTDVYSEGISADFYDSVRGDRSADTRWAIRLSVEDEVDVWLINWAPGASTALHDHAGSLGALTVLSGALSEYRWNGTELQRRTLSEGDRAGFPIGWVHDVTCMPTGAVGDTDFTAPAVRTLSVHAYSPPLTAMSYYEVTVQGTLRRTRTVLTDELQGDR